MAFIETYQIYPIRVAESEIPGADGLPSGMISTHICYLIKGENTLILVDSGPPDNARSTKFHQKMLLEKDARELLAEGLAVLGVKPEDIRIVINTHLHWDHCNNNDLFPNSRIYVQRTEILFALDPVPAPAHLLYYDAYQAGFTPGWVSSAERFEAIDGDYDLLDGIRIVSLPGHSPGFQGVLVNTTGGRYLIAGDAIPFLANWHNRQYGLPKASTVCTDLVANYNSLKKMISICNYVLPGHDKAVFDRLVYP